MTETGQRSTAPFAAGAPAERPRYQNFVIVGVFVSLVSTSMSIGQYKTPTILMPLMEMFNLEATAGSWLMSIFVLMSAIMSIPASILCQKIGPFKVVACATAGIVVGAIVGGFTTSYPVLLFSRGLEGACACAASVVGPVIVESCVNPQRVGTAMGIWGVWGSLGATLGAVITPTIFYSLGRTPLWLFDGGLTIACTVLMFIMVKDPERYNRGKRMRRRQGGGASTAADALREGAGAGAPVSLASNDGFKPRYRDLLCRDCVLVFVAFTMFNVSLLAVLNFVPTLLQLKGMSAGLSGFASTLAAILSIGSSPILGMISDRTGKTRWLLVVATLVMGPCVLLMYTHANWVMWVAAVVMGIVAMGASGICVVALLRALPYPSLKTKAMGVFVTLQGVGSFVAASLVQALLGSDFTHVWLAGGVVCAMCVAGALCYAFCRRIDGMPQTQGK